MQNDAFLGTGWSFPPTFDKGARGVQMVEAETDICQSLEILLATRLGERVLQPTYGCNLDELVFEAMSPSVRANTKELIRDAILYHEPRIRLLGLELIELEPGRIEIQLDYLVISTNSRFNQVFPFYQNEGANLT